MFSLRKLLNDRGTYWYPGTVIGKVGYGIWGPTPRYAPATNFRPVTTLGAILRESPDAEIVVDTFRCEGIVSVLSPGKHTVNLPFGRLPDSEDPLEWIERIGLRPERCGYRCAIYRDDYDVPMSVVVDPADLDFSNPELAMFTLMLS